MNVREHGRISAAALSVLESIGARSTLGFGVALPNGERRHIGPAGEAAFLLVLHDTAPLFAAFARGHIGLLEAYFNGSIDIEKRDE